MSSCYGLRLKYIECPFCSHTLGELALSPVFRSGASTSVGTHAFLRPDYTRLALQGPNLAKLTSFVVNPDTAGFGR
jgi:hypothetical protein